MKKYLIIFLVAVFAAPTFALTSPDGSIQAAVQAAMEASARSLLLPQAMTWLGSFMMLQFLITNMGLLKSGSDIEAIFGKLIGSLMWFGVCIYLLQNGPDFIDSVGTGILQKFMPDWISPGYILTAIGGVILALLTTIGLTGIMALGTGSPMLAIVVIVVLLVVIAVALGLSMKIFMLKLELGLIVMLSPLSFSFLGLNALKDQGIAPFKALISLVYRAILLGVVCAAFNEVSTTTEAALNAIEWGLEPLVWIDKAQIMISSVFAYPMLGYLVWKSDSIAASLASGSTSMGTADVAGAVAAGVAAGSVAGGLASAVGATNPVKSMSDFMKSMGGGGTLSNASSSGLGSSGAGAAAPSAPVSSLGGSGSGGGASSAPAFETNSSGAPMRPDASVSGGAASSGNAGPSGGNGSQPPANMQQQIEGDAARVESAMNSVGGNPIAAADKRSRPGGEWAGSGGGGSGGLSTPSSPSTGSGAGSGVAGGGSGGGSSGLDQKFEKLIDKLDAQGGAKAPSFGDRLKDFGRHVEQEKGSTHVSINTHHSD